MKKVLILLVLVMMGIGEAAAQKYYIPRFKKTKVERDYELENMSHKWSINLGSSFNFCTGMQNAIKYGQRGDNTVYNESMRLGGATFHLGAGYRFNEHIIAGLESGFQLQENGNSVPLYATFKYYYGNAVQTKRHRWFNYMNAGPQFYINDSSRCVGALVAAGGGIRVLVGRTLKTDFYMGYQLNIRNVVPADTGRNDYPASDIKYRQFAHLVQVGMNIPLW
ncbi:MAG: hypothetical protein IKU22_05070 [Alistipes sp.]|nr:hypothetical protein [Alistipes sp.]